MIKMNEQFTDIVTLYKHSKGESTVYKLSRLYPAVSEFKDYNIEELTKNDLLSFLALYLYVINLITLSGAFS